MKLVMFLVFLISTLFLVNVVEADVFNLGNGLANLESVVVDKPGNVGYEVGGFPGPRLCGGVSYSFKMAKYETTVAQYADFLNAKAKSDPYGLYSASMVQDIQRSGTTENFVYSVKEGAANKPVQYVSYWDACRFANWLNNGQGDGDTETGAYTLNEYNGSDGRIIARNISATWFLPSEDEWSKAAYFKGGIANDEYWDYPTQSDELPSNQVYDPDPGNNANYYGDGYGIRSRTNVGEFENSASPFGTFDQGGNIEEWNEGLIFEDIAYTGLRGGGFSGIGGGGFGYNLHRSTSYITANYLLEQEGIGFRIAGVIPEPSGLIALGVGLTTLTTLKRRRKG